MEWLLGRCVLDGVVARVVCWMEWLIGKFAPH